MNVEGRVWRAGTAKLVGKLIGRHEDDLTAIAYSPDGKLIATASLDADAHLWNAPTFTHRRSCCAVTRQSSATSSSAPTGAGSRRPARRQSGCGRRRPYVGSTRARPCSSCAATDRASAASPSSPTAGASRASATTARCARTSASSVARRRSSPCAPGGCLDRLGSNLTPDERKTLPRRLADAPLELVRLAVSALKPACMKSFAAAAASDHVSSRPLRGATVCRPTHAGGRPHADAAAAREQLADRLAGAAVLERPLVALVRLALDERLAEEAEHLVVGDRPGGLERRRGEDREVERAQLLGPPAAQARDRRRARSCRGRRRRRGRRRSGTAASAGR